jgi:hypothetical protein
MSHNYGQIHHARLAPRHENFLSIRARTKNEQTFGKPFHEHSFLFLLAVLTFVFNGCSQEPDLPGNFGSLDI